SHNGACEPCLRRKEHALGNTAEVIPSSDIQSENNTTHRLKGLKCRECGANYPLEARHVCDLCFGPVEVDYNYDVIKNELTRESIKNGPTSIWRYAALLPVENQPKVNLEAG